MREFVVTADTVFGLTPDRGAVYRYDDVGSSWTAVGGPAAHLYGGGYGLIATSPLYRFMRKILEKYNWDVRFGKEMLKAYHEIKPVSKEEWTNLKIRFSYPENTGKLGKLLLYASQKTWISVKNTEKLQNLIRQREAWKR